MQSVATVGGGGGGGGGPSPQPAASAQDPRASALYKTELCRSYIEQGRCRYAFKCRFAHGIEDLRPVARHKKYKTEKCKNFQLTGQCPYGPRCRFIHDDQEAKLARLLNIAAHAQAQVGGASGISPPELQAAIDANPSLTSVITTGHSAGLRLDDGKAEILPETADLGPASINLDYHLPRLSSHGSEHADSRNGSPNGGGGGLGMLQQPPSHKSLGHHGLVQGSLHGSHHNLVSLDRQLSRGSQHQQPPLHPQAPQQQLREPPGIHISQLQQLPQQGRNGGVRGRPQHQRLHSFGSMRSATSNASASSSGYMFSSHGNTGGGGMNGATPDGMENDGGASEYSVLEYASQGRQQSRTVGSLSDLPNLHGLPGMLMERERGLSDSGAPAASVAASVLHDDGLAGHFAGLSLYGSGGGSNHNNNNSGGGGLDHSELQPRVYSRQHSSASSDSQPQMTHRSAGASGKQPQPHLFHPHMQQARAGGDSYHQHPSHSQASHSQHHSQPSLHPQQLGIRLPPKPGKTGSAMLPQYSEQQHQPHAGPGHRSASSVGSVPAHYLAAAHHHQQQQSQSQQQHPDDLHHHSKQQPPMHQHALPGQHLSHHHVRHHSQHQEPSHQGAPGGGGAGSSSGRWQPSFRFEPVNEEDYPGSNSLGEEGLPLRHGSSSRLSNGGGGAADGSMEEIDPRLFLPSNMLPPSPRSASSATSGAGSLPPRSAFGTPQHHLHSQHPGATPMGHHQSHGQHPLQNHHHHQQQQHHSSSQHHQQQQQHHLQQQQQEHRAQAGRLQLAHHPQQQRASLDDNFQHYPHRTSRPPVLATRSHTVPPEADSPEDEMPERSRSQSASLQLWSSPGAGAVRGGASTGHHQSQLHLQQQQQQPQQQQSSQQQSLRQQHQHTTSLGFDAPRALSGPEQQEQDDHRTRHLYDQPGLPHQGHVGLERAATGSLLQLAAGPFAAPAAPAPPSSSGASQPSPSTAWDSMSFSPWIQPALNGGPPVAGASGVQGLGMGATSRPESVSHAAPADLGAGWGSRSGSPVGGTADLDPWDQFSERSRSVSSPMPRLSAMAAAAGSGQHLGADGGF